MQYVEVPLTELDKIPFLAKPIDKDRALATMCFFVENKWRNWLIQGNSVVELTAHPVEALYFADKPEKPTDQLIPILDFIAQHAYFSKLGFLFHGIWNDYHSLAASLAKFKIFYFDCVSGLDWS